MPLKPFTREDAQRWLADWEDYLAGLTDTPPNHLPATNEAERAVLESVDVPVGAAL